MTLSTYAEQVSHYSAVHARLMGVRPEPRVERAIIPPPPSPPKKRSKEDIRKADLARQRAKAAAKAAKKFKPASVLALKPMPFVKVEAHYAWENGPEILPPPVPKWKQIVMEIAERDRIPVGDLMADFREKHIVRARSEIFYRMRHECGLSYVEIGKRMGNRDHSTVIWGCRRHAEKLAGRE